MVLTEEHAATLVDTFEIEETLRNDEEVGLLETHNPLLLEAMEALHEYACEKEDFLMGLVDEAD